MWQAAGPRSALQAPLQQQASAHYFLFALLYYFTFLLQCDVRSLAFPFERYGCSPVTGLQVLDRCAAGAAAKPAAPQPPVFQITADATTMGFSSLLAEALQPVFAKAKLPAEHLLAPQLPLQPVALQGAAAAAAEPTLQRQLRRPKSGSRKAPPPPSRNERPMRVSHMSHSLTMDHWFCSKTCAALFSSRLE